MQLRNRNSTWKLLFLVLISLPYIQPHVLHYLHLKKFLTAIAFARALGKRPTVLPIPIPIPIPIAQNEVIKLPMGGNSAKTTILDGSRGSSQAAAIAQLLGGSSYAGTSKFGYALPSNNIPSVINLSQLKGSDSNIVNSLASALGNGGQTKVLILGGQNPTGSLAASPSVIHMGSGLGSHSNLVGRLPGSSVLSHSNLMGRVPGSSVSSHSSLMGRLPGSSVLSHSNLMGSGLNFDGLTGMDLGLNGLNSGSGFGDLGVASSFSNVIQSPQNAYSDNQRRKPPKTTHRGHNTRGGNSRYSQKGGNSKPCEHCHRPPNNGKRPVRDNFQNAPLTLKFTYRP